MKLVLVLILAVPVVGVLLLAGGLLGNRLPWLDPPGIQPRLKHYLTTHVAETTLDATYPELRMAVYPVSADRLFQAVGEAAARLGWQVRSADPAARTMALVVTTAVWRFKDDVTVRVEAAGSRGSVLHLRSASRVGQGDLGANTRHILDLREALRASL